MKESDGKFDFQVERVDCTQDIHPDEEVEALVQKYMDVLTTIKKEVIGETLDVVQTIKKQLR